MTESRPELARWQPRLAALAAGASGSDDAHDANHLERVWRNARMERCGDAVIFWHFRC
jgi:uncharacterized protein